MQTKQWPKKRRYDGVRFSIYPYLFIAPTMILIGIFSYYAFFKGLWNSLTDYRITNRVTEFVGFENYRTLFGPDGLVFWKSFGNQAIITAFSVINAIFWPLLTAELLFFVRRKRIANTIKSMFVMPMLVPGIVVTLIWRFLYNKSFGFNSLLNTLGLKMLTHDWIPYNMLLIPNYSLIRKFGLLNSYWALIIPYIAGQQIFGIVLARAFFSSLPKEMFDAAKIDGVTEFQAYRLIALPLSVPTLITVGITAIVSMYNDYIWPTIVLTTGDKMKTFCQIVFNNCAGNGTSDYGMTTAAFVIGTLPLLIITVSCLRYYLQGMLAGAIKG